MEGKQGVGAKSEEAGAEDEQRQPETASKCFEAAEYTSGYYLLTLLLTCE